MPTSKTEFIEPIDAPNRRRLPLLLRRSWYGLNQAFRRRIAHLQITPDQFTVLRTLLESDVRGLTQRELARTMSSDPNTVASLLERMEKIGYVERLPHERDRRAHRIKLLAKGKKTYESARGHCGRAPGRSARRHTSGGAREFPGKSFSRCRRLPPGRGKTPQRKINAPRKRAIDVASPSPLNGERFPRKISRIEPLNAQRSADLEIGAPVHGEGRARGGKIQTGRLKCGQCFDSPIVTRACGKNIRPDQLTWSSL